MPETGGTRPPLSDFKRVQVIKSPANSLARDRVVNTVMFRLNGWSPVGGGDQNIANDVRDRFAAYPVFNRGIKTIEVRVYDLEDAPGPPTATATGEITEFSLMAPREVSLCLSFRGENNEPRSRGRIYLGPINAGTSRPAADIRGDALALAQDLANIGGTNVDWCVFSPTTRGTATALGPSFKVVRKAWVDDEWDTMRSRGFRATTRSELDLNG